jgi:t-SNARE complex subunit (syntaxin)
LAAHAATSAVRWPWRWAAAPGGGGWSAAAALLADPGSAFQQLTQAQVAPEGAYLEARASDVAQVERHIHELAGLFGRLATVVAEQGALVERIEDDTDTSLRDVEAGHAQLVRYMARVSSNRLLAAKIFGVLVAFIVLFAVFFA